MVIVYVLVLLILGLLAFAAARPSAFRYERKAVINAPAAAIFPSISDFHAWESWSPWDKIDPELKRSYSGAPSGKGAIYAWEGNNKVGAGRMEITEADSPSPVRIRLDFYRPIKAANTCEFHLQDKGSATEVTWAMFGKNPFMSKLMGIFLNFDKLVGKDFEIGLANLKKVAEK